MNSEWRTLPSLASLGVDAAPSKPRRSSIDPAVHAQLQVAIVDVVEADAKASVRRLALALAIELGKRTGLPEKELPSHNTLRAFIDRELRRRQREQEVGNDLLLDHSACGLLRPDRSTYTLFAIVDTASQIIMGAGLGDVADARAGYRLAARDALSRLGADDFRDLPWSDRVSRIQIVPGDDGTAPFQGVDLHGTAPGIGSNFTAERRAGDYLRKHVGSAIGVVPIWPARMGSAPPPRFRDRSRAEA